MYEVRKKEVNAPSTPGVEDHGKQFDESIPVEAHIDKIPKGTLALVTCNPASLR